MDLTYEQITQVVLAVLGESVDDVSGWRSTGSATRRNVLLTDERIPNRVLNDFDQRILSAMTSVNAFAGRFDQIVGENFTIDKDTFEEIGSNLIVAIRSLQLKIVELEDKPGYVPTEEERLVLESGITKEVLDDIILNLLSTFSPTPEQLDAINSGVTSEGLAEIKNDIVSLQEGSVLTPMTGEDLDIIFDEVFNP